MTKHLRERGEKCTGQDGHKGHAFDVNLIADAPGRRCPAWARRQEVVPQHMDRQNCVRIDFRGGEPCACIARPSFRAPGRFCLAFLTIGLRGRGQIGRREIRDRDGRQAGGTDIQGKEISCAESYSPPCSTRRIVSASSFFTIGFMTNSLTSADFAFSGDTISL